MLPERIRQLDVAIAGSVAGQLLKQSIYEFRYLRVDEPHQAALSLAMPASCPTYQDGDLFPVMDQNLPEGDLYLRLRSLFPKQALTPMHLLALVGANSIGRLGYALPGAAPVAPGRTLSRASLLAIRYTPEVFDDLVAAYLATGAGIAGMQPKIMVPDRFTIPVPTLIVKAASPAYPELEDRTLALKLFTGRGETRAYPTTERLLDFGRRVCGVAQPAQVLQRITTAMRETLAAARGDDRIPPALLSSMAEVWQRGMV